MTQVRVRFAPSPTGFVHIGNARTALYNYLFAQAKGGKLILRIEDTDQERSRREYEVVLLRELRWLGISFDEGPNEGGAFGPYRQSERLDIYEKMAQKLIDSSRAFHCFCTEEELAQKKTQSLNQGGSGHYDGTCRDLSEMEISLKRSQGLSSVIRFRAYEKNYEFIDHVRGKVNFPQGMVGDFVLMRSDRVPVYNFAVVVDDILMKITHVIRGEDHLNNTVRQLMIYEGLGEKAPEFAHASLLIGKDRQKLSKREGSTSVTKYREEHYLPQALVNYLCLLGWSHPEQKDIFSMEEAARLFDIDRLNDSPAVYDLEKLAYINSQHLRALGDEELIKEVETVIPKESLYHQQSGEWKIAFCKMCKRDMQFSQDILPKLELVFNPSPPKDSEYDQVRAWPSTLLIKNYLYSKLAPMKSEFLELSDWENLASSLKSDLKLKGKELFQGMRLVLTGQAHGPDLKELIVLTPLSILKQRVDQIF